MGLLLVLLLIAWVTSPYACSDSEPWLNRRLPRSLSPTHYKLFLQPYINQRKFVGNVSIEMNVLNQTNYIVIHAVHLNISSAQVFVNNTTSLKVIRAFPYENNSYWVVETEQPMMTGVPVKLDLVFSGNLMIFVGIVKTGYKNEKTGDYSPVVITAFKPNYSRMAFPNFDEPFFKARFTITLRHWANLTAASNMQDQKVEDIDSDWRETQFKRSLIQSSFSVSFVISNFTYREGRLPNGMQHRVWARPDLIDRVDYALNVTQILQRSFVRDLGHLRTLRKIDHFALPFLPYRGGLACLGLISHNEEQLISNSSHGDKHRLTNLALIAFELARTYFGIFITCEKWDHIWLDSGLAAFYGLRAASNVETISFYEQLLEERGLNDDALSNSRPLVLLEPNTTEEHDGYDLLPIAKGSALLKMMENFLGADTFNRGIIEYIRRNKYKTVLTQDLFDAFQTVAGASTNITMIMNTWVYRVGYPLITIEVRSDKRIRATQKRFLMDALVKPDSPPPTQGYEWFVPLSYRTNRGNTGLVWINETDANFDNLLDVSDTWVIFNHDGSGYYRVNYERSMWTNITKQLKTNHTVFTERERSQLLSDALNLAKAEQLRFDIALNLTMYALKERLLSPWTHICDALENIHHLLSNTSCLAHYQQYVLNLTTNVMNELRVTDEGTVEDKLLRQKILPLSCFAGHRGCIENTTRIFKAWIQNDTLNTIPENIRRSVYCSGIANSELESEWNTTFKRFLVKGDDEEKDELRLSLACTKNLTLIGRFLEMCLSNNSAGSETLWFHDLKRAAMKFRSNPTATSYTWEWLKVHRAEIDARFYPGASANLVHAVAHNFNTQTQLQEVRSFFAGMNSSAHVKEREEQTVERIEANIRWMGKQYATVSLWLKRNIHM